MTTDDNIHAISYYSKHTALSAMYALAQETFITNPEIVISISCSNKKSRMCAFSRDEGSLPDKTEWERIENDKNIEAVTMVASTDAEDKRRFSVIFFAVFLHLER